jgi:hypothetical protein
VNCAECQTEPLTPGHYCPCCGRKLSLQERRAGETASPVACCQSCGGPSADGDLCKSCQEASAPVVGSAIVTEVSDDSATAGAQTAAAVDETTEVALPPPVVKVDAVKMETAKAVADLTAKAHLAKAANPAVITRRPIVSDPPQRRSRTRVLIAAAAAIVVAIGAAEGARRLGFHWPPRAAGEGQPVQVTPTQVTPAVEDVTATEREAAPRDISSAAKAITGKRASASTPARAVVRPAARTAAARPRAVRQATSSNPQVVPVVAPAPAPETPAPVPAGPPTLVAVESPRTSAPPAGRFYERSDVDESPQIATRVEPRLPANLPVRASNVIVVVRMLVSRTGHPYHVTLLRGSMLGRASDEAVVAAVMQWTFSPAKRRGEPVNCWYNIGVPLGQAD